MYPNYINQNLSKIYKNIFTNIINKEIICFLCGKASDNTNPSKRDLLRQKIDSDQKSPIIRIVYAEELFKSIVNIRSEDNLLELENILAESADAIVIVLESAGAFVELGAFSNVDVLSEKLIVLMSETFKHDESFINLGPVKKLRKKNNHIIYYRDNSFEDVTLRTLKAITSYESKKEKQFRLQSLIVMIYFVELLIYFFAPITFDELMIILENVIEDDIENLNTRLRASIAYLTRTEKTVISRKNKFYILTAEGYSKLKNTLKTKETKFGSYAEIDKIRLSILNFKLRKDKKLYKEYSC